ncbi:WD repeat protein [Phyllosticta citricarpa]
MHSHGDSSPFDSPTFGRDASIRVDEPVGSASMSPSSRDVVLASREGLHIIDLDNPYSPPRHLAHRTLWEVADVQWSPFACRDGLVASTSNQKALIWDLNHATQPPLTLHAHSRAITDINLSAHHPDLLATCAVDTFVHKWDLRASDRPVFSYAQWDGGAAQVKWNRQDPHILASAHDKFLCIWDERKGVYPLRTIEAHRSKIYGVDWNRMRAGGILTCSLDGSIKFWDYTKDEDSMLERVIRTPFGVWRARHTPFGWGTLAMPQRGDFDLHLYDRRLGEGVKKDAAVRPVHTFKGHNDQVKEFLWRTRGGISSDGIDEREFQLVSWGSDRQLNLYRVDASILGHVGHEIGAPVRPNYKHTRQGAVYKTFHDEAPISSIPGKTTQPPHAFSTAPSQLSALFQSAGMSKPSLPYAQTALQGPGASARERGLMGTSGTMQARTREKKTVDKLTWMQGVKIGGPNGHFNRHGSRPDILSPEQHLVWDSPDSLGDEITHVGSKYKKVKFEEVEIPKRTATVTLNGPWGENGDPVFMRISIRFPPNYPVSATPDCKIEKTTSFISPETEDRLESEIKALAEVYKNRKRGSLDAIISYLLGERGLEESISWLSEAGEGASSVDEESSSDEEDEVGGDFSGTPAMEMSGTDILGPVNANANVPLPKQCGAIWAPDGRLITFFPPKPEPKPMFSNLATLSSDSRTYKSKRIFEMLGRLKTASPEPDRKDSSTMSHDDAESQGSWETSSSSSSGSPVMGGISGIAPPVAWRGGPLKFQRSSQHSSAGYESRPSAPKPKSIITIHDFADLLPAKRELAEDYEIFGEGPSVCNHNAKVAREHGYADLADIWNLVGLILANEVPLEIMQQSYRREPILIVARRFAVHIKKRDSGLDLSYDEPDAVTRPKLKGRVKWGNHPFAQALVARLFEHFERLADTQMLAMLSCMFHEPAASEGVTNGMMMRLPHADLHLSMRTPAFSLDYYPTREVASSLFQPTLSVTDPSNGYERNSMGSDPAFGKSDRRLNTFGSAGSSNGPWSGDVMSSTPIPHSTSNTPPLFSRVNPYRASGFASIASSPERNKRSNLSTAFSTFSRPFTNAGPSPSPPVNSRTGDLSSSAPEKSGVTWGPNTVYDPSSSQGRSSTGQLKRSRTGLSQTPPRDVIVQVKLKNQDQFDDDGHLSVPLLDQSREWLHLSYRQSYADQELMAWGLVRERCEVLKFNGMVSYWVEEEPRETSDWMAASKETEVRSLVESDTLALETLPCGTTVSSSDLLPWLAVTPPQRPAPSKITVQQGEVGGMNKTEKIKSRVCMVCWLQLDGLYRTCANCGHAVHTTCGEACLCMGD